MAGGLSPAAILAYHNFKQQQKKNKGKSQHEYRCFSSGKNPEVSYGGSRNCQNLYGFTISWFQQFLQTLYSTSRFLPETMEWHTQYHSPPCSYHPNLLPVTRQVCQPYTQRIYKLNYSLNIHPRSTSYFLMSSRRVCPHSKYLQQIPAHSWSNCRQVQIFISARTHNTFRKILWKRKWSSKCFIYAINAVKILLLKKSLSWSRHIS